MAIKRFKCDKDGQPEDIAAARKNFEADGVIILEGLMPEEDVKKPVQELEAAIKAALAHHNVNTETDDIDRLYKTLWKTDPEKAEICMGLGRDLPSFLQIISSPRLRNIVTLLLDDDRHMSVHDLNLMRVDGKETQKGAFHWHQDYPFNLLSKDAVTIWMPLRSITQDMGTMKVIPGSHDHLRKIYLSGNTERHNPNNLELVGSPEDIGEWEKSAVDIGDINAGSVVFFDCKLMHRSGENKTDRFRWVANCRYGRIADEALIKRNWYTVRTKYPLLVKDVHPELLVEQES